MLLLIRWKVESKSKLISSKHIINVRNTLRFHYKTYGQNTNIFTEPAERKCRSRAHEISFPQVFERSWGFKGPRHWGWHGEQEADPTVQGQRPSLGVGGEAPEAESFSAFGRQKEVANLLLSLYFANSVKHGYQWFVSLKLKRRQQPLWQWQTDNLTVHR